jgi:hypothetical protein
LEQAIYATDFDHSLRLLASAFLFAAVPLAFLAAIILPAF